MPGGPYPKPGVWVRKVLIFERRVAPVPVRSPVHAEGAPEPALSLPKGPSLLGTGDGSQVAHSSWYRELGTDPPICEPQTDGWIGERDPCLVTPPPARTRFHHACTGSPGSSIHPFVARCVYTCRSTTINGCPVACPERGRKPAMSLPRACRRGVSLLSSEPASACGDMGEQ
jgi:hypothetical protein